MEFDSRVRVSDSESRFKELEVAESNRLVALLLFLVALQGAESSSDFLGIIKLCREFL